MNEEELRDAVRLLAIIVDDLARQQHNHRWDSYESSNFYDYGGNVYDDNLKRLLELVGKHNDAAPNGEGEA